jgi:hypothetical protein
VGFGQRVGRRSGDLDDLVIEASSFDFHLPGRADDSPLFRACFRGERDCKREKKEKKREGE